MSRKKTQGTKNQRPARPEQDGGEEESTKRHVYVEHGVKIDLVEDLKQQQQSSEAHRSTHQKRQLFWTKVASGLLLLTAGLTAWQGFLTRQIIKDASKQFRIDQRPYVWTNESAEPFGMHVVKGERLTLSVDWVNYGRSPALREASLGQIYIGPNAMQQADRWFAGLGDKPLPPPPDGLLKERVIPPGIGSRDRGFGGFSTFFSDHELTEDEFDYIMHTDRSIAIIIRVDYYDAYGNRYWDDICLSRFQNGAIPHCDRHNEIH